MAIRILYSSLAPTAQAVAEHATRAAIGSRPGDWSVCFIEPPRQPLCVIVIDGPNGFTHTWCFDPDDVRYEIIRGSVRRDLSESAT